jgi:hypothetical protein
MGIDRNYADFLLGARNGGVDFRQTATLGRLNLFVNHRSLDAVFREHGDPVTDDDVRAMRTAAGGYSEAFLRRLGAQETTSVDASEYEGAADRGMISSADSRPSSTAARLSTSSIFRPLSAAA